MAPKAKKARVKTPERLAVEEFDKRHTGDLSDSQSAQREKLVHAMRAAEFKKITNTRATRALRALRGVGDMANPRRYSFTPEQVKKLADALRGALDSALNRFDAALKAPQKGTKAASGVAEIV